MIAFIKKCPERGAADTRFGAHGPNREVIILKVRIDKRNGVKKVSGPLPRSGGTPERDGLCLCAPRFTPRGAHFLVSLDVEINPRFYRGRKERSDNRKGELDASRKI